MTITSELKRSKKAVSNIGFWQILFAYRLPLSGYVSIFHRFSGAVLFLLLPFVMLLFDQSLTSELSFEVFKQFLPNIVVKLIVLALSWAFFHHFCAGIRHLLMDVNHDAVSKEGGKRTAVVVFVVSIALTIAMALKLFGAF
ncbi:succinate dehydrogenase, cytochrome b556 subunit [Burkholderia pseudomallei]|nr:succinate dehydrogenase, cytochrome b556 subunit [Burkholderia pseudomallei]MBM5584956.1 succinate dehydrogenase, cytochrome b556 subunit [Burkholderia pseudomallei]